MMRQCYKKQKTQSKKFVWQIFVILILKILVYFYMYIYIYNIYIIYIYIYIYTCNNIIESLQRAWLVEYDLIGEMKSQFFTGMLPWVSYHCIHQAFYLLYIFCLPKLNKNRNTKVYWTITLSKKPLHIVDSHPICSEN